LHGDRVSLFRAAAAVMRFGARTFSGRKSVVRRVVLALSMTVLGGGCARAPSPLTPHFGGSIGLPHRGVLTASAELPRLGSGFRWLRDDGRHHGVPRLVAAIERAAARVDAERPGPALMVGDLSAPGGGRITGHASHRTGRDVDLLLYLTTPAGAPIESPGFVSVGSDGLAFDEKKERFYRLDVEREWLLVKALVENDAARVQWIFVSRAIEALLVEWARARGESPETILRAMDVMQQPAPPALPHDDHIHVRTACSPNEIAAGCEPTGPERPWIAAVDGGSGAGPDVDTAELVVAILSPMDAAVAASGHAKTGP
jgi:penicillin-insensitive murein endopeptidase